MKRIFSKIDFLKNKKVLPFVFVLALFGVFICVQPASANPLIDFPLAIFTTIMHTIITALGFMASALIWVLIAIAKISNFTQVPGVTQGWVIVLNFCNMFFILILLIIAFATILRVESYNAKKLLPRLLIAAVLINFSKTICGVIIDFAQLIMLTFVYSFDNVGGANFANMLGLPWLVKFSDKAPAEMADLPSIAGAYILGIVYVVIAISVLGAIIGVLVARVVMIWIHVVISPLAYLASTFPQGQSFANKWWDDFIRHVFIGPILAFFIWLSFISMQGVAQKEDVSKWLDIKQANGELVQSTNAPSSLTETGSVDHMIQFAISIGMLLGGLMMAQAAGGALGKAAQIGEKVARGGLTAGLDKLNRMQARGGEIKVPFTNKSLHFGGTGIDLNMKRKFGSLMTGRQTSLNQELLDMKENADRNAERGGVIGLATGMDSDGWYGRYMSLKGMGRVAQSVGNLKWTEAGMLKKMKGEQIDVERRRDTVYSQEELDAERITGDKRIIDDSNARLIAKRQEITDRPKTLMAEKTALQSDLLVQNDIIMKNAPGSQAHIDAQAKANDLKLKIKAKDNDFKTARTNQSNDLRQARQDENDRRRDEKLELDAKLDLKEKNSRDAKVFVATTTEADTRRQKLTDQSKKISDDIVSSAYFDYRIQKSHAKAVREEEQNISAEDEDQLVVQFRNAVADNNANRAEAIVRKLAPNRGTNTLLLQLGYKDVNADTFSQFVEDYFEKKMGVSSQTAMSMQADLDGVAQSTGVIHLLKTVNIDETGKYRRLAGAGVPDKDKEARRNALLADMQKQDSETLARKGTRLLYGAEGNDKKFKWEKDGLTLFLNNLQGYSKELKGNRFNKNAATQISKSDEAMAQLRSALESSDKLKELVKQGSGASWGVDDFMNALALRGTEAPEFEFTQDSRGNMVATPKT